MIGTRCRLVLSEALSAWSRLRLVLRKDYYTNLNPTHFVSDIMERLSEACRWGSKPMGGGLNSKLFGNFLICGDDFCVLGTVLGPDSDSSGFVGRVGPISSPDGP